MKFGIFYELQLPRPWGPNDELTLYQNALEQIELADKCGYDYAWQVEHHFLEEYSISSAPEIMLAAAAMRTRRLRLGHGIIQMPPLQNHPARVAERIATLDLVSNGRVEFGTGEGATTTELAGFGTEHSQKKEAWEEATRECLRMMSETPYPGYQGTYFSMPERNLIPKPLQKPHPPVWVAAARRETAMIAARLGMGAIGFGFETPEEADERVARYWDLIRGCRAPIGKAINPALVTVGNMRCAETDELAVERGLEGAQFFGFSLGWTHGPVKHGHDHVYREFRRRQEAQQTAAARESATSLEPADESADDAAAVLVALLPASAATANRGPRTDFSELMILSRSASGIVPPTLTAFPSNSACDPGVLKLSSAALRSFVQPAWPTCLSTARPPVILSAPNSDLRELVIAARVASSPTVPE